MNTRRFLLVLLLPALLLVGCIASDEPPGGGTPPPPPHSVLINGVTWATRNVDAPGTFAANPENYGMFYQWNHKTGWSSTGPLTSSPPDAIWDTSTPTSDKWSASNDPCPVGWRVPAIEELAKLLETANVSRVWATEGTTNGYRFTDKTSGSTVFFPAAGYRNATDGMLYDAGSYGLYWSSSPYSTGISWSLNFGSTVAYQNNYYRNLGFSVRCVIQ